MLQVFWPADGCVGLVPAAIALAVIPIAARQSDIIRARLLTFMVFFSRRIYCPRARPFAFDSRIWPAQGPNTRTVLNCGLQGLCVVDHPLEIHDHRRLVSDNPGVVPR